MKLSVIIVTYNSAADIAPCLKSIAFCGDYEIIVIDNASKDQTRAILDRCNYPQIKRIYNQQNLGYARANNQGLTIARGEYVLLLNPDTVIQPGAIDLLVHHLDQHPEIAAVAPRLLNPDNTQQLSIRSFPTFTNVLAEMTGLPRLFPLWRKLGSWRLRHFDYEKPALIQQPMASCLLIRRSVLSEIGGFDENFPIYYNDVDLSYRMFKKGYKTAYLPRAVVYHKVGASTAPLKTKMIFENHRALLRYLKKHNTGAPFFFKAIILLPLLEIAAILRVVAHLLKNHCRTKLFR